MLRHINFKTKKLYHIYNALKFPWLYFQEIKARVHFLNYRVQGSSIAAIFSFKLSFFLCTYIPRNNVMFDFICMATVDLPGARSKATKCKMNFFCSQWDSNGQRWDLNSDALPNELIGLCYLNDLYTYMYFRRYQCIHWYVVENEHDQTVYLIWYLHVESKHRTRVSLCYLNNIAIFQYVTQNSTFTRQIKLHFTILELTRVSQK